MVSSSELTQFVTVLVSIALFSDTALGYDDNCRLLQSTVPLTRNVAITHGGQSQLAECSTSVTLNKCEGTCESSVSPSVRNFRGFRKDCRCCKETATETREIALTCFVNGQEIPNFQQSVTVREITGCVCENCGD